MKLLLLLIIVYLVYRAGKSWLVRTLQSGNQSGSPNARIDDVMVQDPVCGIYFPQREGVMLRHGGQTHVFCSEACRDRFLEAQKEK
ncbi:hypothetical protein DSCA_00960 [Desulfosarcina alkanivorans]|uniref:TRASH domain-containing protein n=1 Tax=Desulfosarcina alkanivorans TaxID=571177 RepID=A0A5K7YB88_9BACT|nr:YHS domain-containing protein [Desulfosarcina alkanivorans]BBO66166.1 hypothetical protein DSCA_00960 [Desulfosarcina alkanivorans]